MTQPIILRIFDEYKSRNILLNININLCWLLIDIILKSFYYFISVFKLISHKQYAFFRRKAFVIFYSLSSEKSTLRGRRKMTREAEAEKRGSDECIHNAISARIVRPTTKVFRFANLVKRFALYCA